MRSQDKGNHERSGIWAIRERESEISHTRAEECVSSANSPACRAGAESPVLDIGPSDDTMLYEIFSKQLLPALQKEPLLDLAVRRAMRHIDELGLNRRSIEWFTKEVATAIECTSGPYSLIHPVRRVRLRFAARAVLDRVEGWG